MPTFGSANVALPVGDARVLKINEWLADALAVYPTDFIEIYNPDALPVDLGGLYLTDEPAGFPTRQPLVPLSFVSAGGHVVFRADDKGDEGEILYQRANGAEPNLISVVINGLCLEWREGVEVGAYPFHPRLDSLRLRHSSIL